MSISPERTQHLLQNQQGSANPAPNPNTQPSQDLQNSISRAAMYNQQQAQPSPIVQGPNLNGVADNSMIQSMMGKPPSEAGQNRSEEARQAMMKAMGK